MAAGVAWMSFVSILRADAPASIEIVGVKLTDKNKISVEFEEKNVSDKDININPDMWVRLASLDGKYYDDDPRGFRMENDDYKPTITIYADLFKAQPDGSRSLVVGNWMGNLEVGNYHPPPPVVLKPGEKKDVSVAIDMYQLLLRNFMVTLSGNIWIQVGLYRSGGNPTREEGNAVFSQYHLVTPEEYARLQINLLNKYAPQEFVKGNLYKLEKPKEAESGIGLETLKAPF